MNVHEHSRFIFPVFYHVFSKNREHFPSFGGRQKGGKMSDIPQLRTAGVIADALGVPKHRVIYLLDKHRVRPIGRAGIIRLYDADAVEIVRRALGRGEEANERK